MRAFDHKADFWAMAAKGLFLAVALVAFAGCVAIDVEPLVEPIVALEEIEGVTLPHVLAAD